MTADEFLELGLRALRDDFAAGVDGNGTIAPMSMREFLLALALDKIATGEIGQRKAREYAQKALESWRYDLDPSVDVCSDDATKARS